MLSWELGDLAGKSEGSISLTLQVDVNATLGQEVILEAGIATGSEEIENLNNQVQKVVYLGYAGVLPIIRR
jgi:hypothetical protein